MMVLLHSTNNHKCYYIRCVQHIPIHRRSINVHGYNPKYASPTVAPTGDLNITWYPYSDSPKN